MATVMRRVRRMSLVMFDPCSYSFLLFSPYGSMYIPRGEVTAAHDFKHPAERRFGTEARGVPTAPGLSQGVATRCWCGYVWEARRTVPSSAPARVRSVKGIKTGSPPVPGLKVLGGC
jgi:hypothetical protein